MKIVLFVGLPKTATTFFELNLFPELDENEVIFNPPLMEKLSYLLDTKNDLKDNDINNFKSEVAALARKNNNKILLVVNEHLGYWDWLPDPKIGSERTKSLFPDAKILISLRFQRDWLLSLYKHSIDTGGGYGGIKRFLDYKNGSFQSKGGKIEYNDIGYRDIVVDVFNINWHLFVNCFIEKYGRESVQVMFFENFLENKISFTENLCRTIGIMSEIPMLSFHKKINRSPSALSCIICELQRAVILKLRIKPRSIQEWNEIVKKNKLSRSISGNKKSFKYLCKVTYYVLTKAPLQFFLKLLDELIYIDWNLLNRNKMDSNLIKIYQTMNKDLLEILDEAKIPARYIKS